MKRLFIILIFLSSLAACKKDTTISKISGTLYLDCETAANTVELGLKSSDLSGNNEPLILGSAITNRDGSFAFTYEVEDNTNGKADLILFKEKGYETIISDLPLKLNLDLNLFLNNTSTLILNLASERVLDQDDTLFYGVLESDIINYKVQAENGILDTISIEISNTIEDEIPATIYYGIGMEDFLISKEATTIKDSVYQNIKINLKSCTTIEADSLKIN